MKAVKARVSDLAEQVRGVSYGKTEATKAPKSGYVPILRAGNITDEGLHFEDLVFVPKDRVAEKQRLRRGDVVIAASSGSLDVVGKAASVTSDFEGSFGAFCKVLRPNGKVDPVYFAHFFRTQDYRKRVSALAAGININNLRNEHLDDLELAVPPLDEQRHIAAVLDKADELRAKRRATLAELDTLTESIFLEMFGNPATNSMQWPQTTLAEVAAQKANNGIFKKNHEYSSDTHGTVPVVWVEELFRGDALDTGQSRHLPANSNEIQKYGLRKGDILFCRSSLKLDGIAYNNIYEGEDDGALFECHIIRLRPDSSKIDPVFLNVLMRTPSMREVAKSKAKTATMTTIDQHNLGSIPIPLPPLAQQRDFAVRFSEIRRLRKQMEQSLAEMATLFASLQWRAFRGELPKTNK